jgi:hypothetical protein
MHFNILAGMRGLGYKRRIPDNIGNQLKTHNDLVVPKLPAHGYPLEHPFSTKMDIVTFWPNPIRMLLTARNSIRVQIGPANPFQAGCIAS